jgi:hypothetical protein
VFIGLAGAGSLVTLYVAADATPLLRTLVQPATGVIAGMFLQPSTSGLVALVTAAMILTSATPARC